ncbi:hypothetical protein BB560_001462 [Smittium megazygosporum]|uniref:Cytochrome P450 n=1 Tax=Smittium megazygosporum TaxID=133381 RepID=A0A2T9ZHI8_9FUNG|nr:hypothetical protein BB560_001462 [Smittium megazygosporum]
MAQLIFRGVSLLILSTYHIYTLVLSPSLSIWGILLQIKLFFVTTVLLLNFIKQTLLFTLSPDYKNKFYPQTINVGSKEDETTIAFTKNMFKKGYAVKYDIIPNNFVLSSVFISEFLSHSRDTFSVIKGIESTIESTFKNKQVVITDRICKNDLRLIFNGKYIDSLIFADSCAFKTLIDHYIDSNGQFYSRAFYRVLGKRLAQNKIIRDTLNSSSTFAYLYKSWLFKPVGYFWKMYEHIKYQYRFNKMAEIIRDELECNRGLGSIYPQETNIMDILASDKSININRDPTMLTWAIIKNIKCMTSIPLSRLINIIIDISSDITVHEYLLKEQRRIVARYGEEISYTTVCNMTRLKSFVNKSLLKSSPGSYMHRMLEHDIVLSNGMSISKGSLVSLDIFSYYNLKLINRFNRNRFGRTKFSGSFKNPKINYENLIWGHKKKYMIYLNTDGYIEGHPGYEQVSTVISKSNSIFLEIHDLFDS